MTRYEQHVHEVKPPEDWIEFAHENGRLNRNYLIYRDAWVYSQLKGRKVRMARVKCSACKYEWFADKSYPATKTHYGRTAPFGFYADMEGCVISGDTTLCPNCMCQATAKHISDIERRIYDSFEFVSYGREGDAFAIYDWYSMKTTDRDGEQKYFIHPADAWFFEKRKCVEVKQGHQLSRVGSTVGVSVSHRYNIDANHIIGTTMENSKLDIYMHECRAAYPAAYLRLYQRYKNVENLITAGYSNYVTGLITFCGKDYGVSWREKKPHKMLGLSKHELKELAGSSPDRVDIYKTLKALGAVKTPEEFLPVAQNLSHYTLESLISDAAKNGEDTGRLIKYVLKQGGDYWELRDYRNMAKEIGRDMTDERVLYPKDLKYSHDYLMRLKAEGKAYNKERSAQISRRAEELTRLSWEKDGILIRPAADEKELNEEGTVLHHCVGTYAGRVARGETSIFFIRHSEQPEEPWYTLELKEQNGGFIVAQNRGMRNCGRTPEVQQFETEWLAHISKLKTEKGKISA